MINHSEIIAYLSILTENFKFPFLKPRYFKNPLFGDVMSVYIVKKGLSILDLMDRRKRK